MKSHVVLTTDINSEKTKIKATLAYQQGDVLLHRIKRMPRSRRHYSADGFFQGRIILATGEATGHVHELENVKGNNEFKWDLDSERPIFYVRVKEPSKLTHQEHETITVDPGVYIVDRVREFNYAGYYKEHQRRDKEIED